MENSGSAGKLFFAAYREEFFVTGGCVAKCRLAELMRVRLLRYDGCMYVGWENCD